MFFVVTTGRSGSQTMANVLSQHPLCTCLHEPRPILIKLATERCHGQIKDDELRHYLYRPHNPQEMFPHRVGLRLYGESDQKASYVIPVLADLGLNTKFIWLIRHGQHAVASMFSRGWYGSEEALNPSHLWAKYRIQGDLCGDVSLKTWRTLSPFEKCCWYWSYTNRIIAQDLETLAATSWMLLRLEDLAYRINDLLNFLDLPYYPLRIIRANISSAPTHRPENWSEQERVAFNAWCGQEMDRWYLGWRDCETVPPVSENGHVRGRSWDIVLSINSHAKWLATKTVRRMVSKIPLPEDPSW